MSTLPRTLIEILSSHTPFAEAIVHRQLERLGQTEATLTSAGEAQLKTNVLLAAKMYLEPTTYAAIEQRVRAGEPRGRGHG